MTPARRALLISSTGLLAGLGGLALVLASDHESNPLLTAIVFLSIGWAFVGSGALAVLRRPDNRTGILLAVVGLTFLLGVLTEANSSLVHTTGIALNAVAIAAFLHLLLAYPRGRLESRLQRALVVAGYGVALAGPLLLLLFAKNPPQHCDGCPANAFFLSERPRVEDVLNVLINVGAAAVLAAASVVLVRRWRSASAAYRRSLRSVLFSGGLALALFSVSFVVDTLSTPVSAGLQIGAAVAVVAVPVLFAAGLLRSRFAAGTAGRLVTQLGRTPEPDALRDALREALHDPSLQLAYWLPEAGAYVDAEGRFFEPPEGRALTTVEDEEGVIAALVHDASLTEEPELVQGVVTTARLAILNERFQAELRARVNELERERDFTRLVVDSTPALFCVVDDEGRIVRFNLSLERLTGIPDDERIRGLYFWDVFSVPEEAEATKAALAAAAASLRRDSREFSLPVGGLQPRIVSWLDVPIPDEHGQLRFVLRAGLDVTERNRTLADLRQMAEEQTALRRVATLVARSPSETLLLGAVTEEAAKIFGADAANVVRVEGKGIRVVGGWSAETGRALASGIVLPDEGDAAVLRALQTGRPARVDSLREVQDEAVRDVWERNGIRAAIAAPVVVDGADWGGISVFKATEEPFPPGAESRLEDFAALVAQAIGNAEARTALTSFVAEQAALRRVATLVATGPGEEELLAAVTEEVAGLFEAQAAQLWRARPDGSAEAVRGWNEPGSASAPQGALHPPDPDTLVGRVLATRGPARIDSYEMRHGAEADLVRSAGLRSGIAGPVVVQGALWGVLVVARTSELPFPSWAERRLSDFAALVAQAVGNAQASEEVRASRARIVEAADDARRKLERNLHDGAQQRLVALSIALRLATARLKYDPDAAHELLERASDELTQALDELRELARGIHPAILSDRGLGPALEALAARSPVPVRVENRVGGRLPPPVEAAAYYVVSESLANVAKYAQASLAAVRLTRVNGVAQVEVEDDGVGGADPSRGSGLRGLADRVEALDGRLDVGSGDGRGTVVRAEIPLAAE